jgi:hypothetical protein
LTWSRKPRKTFPGNEVGKYLRGETTSKGMSQITRNYYFYKPLTDFNPVSRKQRGQVI